MGLPPVSIEFLTTMKELDGFRGEWTTLGADVGGSPYLSYEWLTSALHHFPPAGGFYIAAVRDDRGLRGIVPLQLSREWLGPIPLRVLRFAADGWAVRNGPLLAARAAGEGLAATVGAVAALQARGVVWDCSCLRLLPAGSPPLRVFEPEARNRDAFAAADVVGIGGSVVIELPRTTKVYRESLSRNRREKTRKGVKLLRQGGELRLLRLGLEPGSSPEGLGPLLDDALGISARSWQGGTSTGNAISDRGIRDFFREVSLVLAGSGMLDLAVLYVGDRPVAFTWGAARWPYTSINKLGYDQEFSRCGPGNVHMDSLVVDSIERGGREIEFGHEYPEYKRRWGTREDALCDMFLYPRGPLPTLVRRARALKRAVRGMRWGRSGRS